MSFSAVQIEPLLAGTQCRQCGYPGCAEYAEAIVNNAEKLNRCRPGGARVHRLLQQELGQTEPNELFQEPLASQVAEIKEKDCIGCTLCLQICPTGAVVGSNKSLHAIFSDLCTGCGLCVPVCPADCIAMHPAPEDHKLTQHQSDGSLAAAAGAASWQLVRGHRQRQSLLQNRAQKEQKEAQPVELSTISGDVAAKIAAARQKSREKYAAKGPLKTPKHLVHK